MPLTINLLHEQQFLRQQRQRDPLKLGLYALGGVAALFVLYYVVRYAQSSAIDHELKARQAEWAKQEPAAKAADLQEKEYTTRVSAADAVGKRIEGRFYWAPLLATLIKAVPPNVQVLNFTGTNDARADKIGVTLEGIVAGDQPRLSADKFRSDLTAALAKKYSGVETVFRSLDDSVSPVAFNGKPSPTARFTIEIKMGKLSAPPAAPAPVAARR